MNNRGTEATALQQTTVAYQTANFAKCAGETLENDERVHGYSLENVSMKIARMAKEPGDTNFCSFSQILTMPAQEVDIT